MILFSDYKPISFAGQGSLYKVFGSSQCAVCIINWNDYAPLLGRALSFTFVGQSAQIQSLKRIDAICIDNTRSLRTLALRLEDTGHIINCGPGEWVNVPVLTAETRATLFQTGHVALANDEQTRVFFLESYLSGFGMERRDRVNLAARDILITGVGTTAVSSFGFGNSGNFVVTDVDMRIDGITILSSPVDFIAYLQSGNSYIHAIFRRYAGALVGTATVDWKWQYTMRAPAPRNAPIELRVANMGGLTQLTGSINVWGYRTL